MELFNFLKRKKPSANEQQLMDKVALNLFGGKEQLRNQIIELDRILKHQYNYEQIANALTWMTSRFPLSGDRSSKALVDDGQMNRKENPFDYKDAMDIYMFVAKKSFEKKFPNAPDSIYDAMYENLGNFNTGATTDIIPGAFGEYGLSVTNPIPVRGIPANETYLKKLSLLCGEPFHWTRLGSFAAPNIKKPIDGYDIITDKGEKLCTLFISPYQQIISNTAPKGFYIINGLTITERNIQIQETADISKYSSMSEKRIELIKRLEDISSDETEYETDEEDLHFNFGIGSELNFDCDICGKKVKTKDYKWVYTNIHKRVKEMCELGFDVKLEELCLDCMLSKVNSKEYIFDLESFGYVMDYCTHWDRGYKQKIKDYVSKEDIVKKLKAECGEKVFMCFYFRSDKSEKYHMIQENSLYRYETVLLFLEDKRFDRGIGKPHILKKEIDDIERMTGLSKQYYDTDIKPPL